MYFLYYFKFIKIIEFECLVEEILLFSNTSLKIKKKLNGIS